MNLRDLGIKWEHDNGDLTLWMHPARNFGKTDIVRDILDEVLPHTEKRSATNSWRELFLIAECFVLDYEYTGSEDTALVRFWRNRRIFDVRYNLELFMSLIQFNDVDFLIDAFQDTRIKSDPEDVKKKTSTSDSNGSVKQETSESAKTT